MVPVGALTGPVVLATPAGRTQSPVEFSVNPTMAILPTVNRMLTGQTVAFTIAQSGLRSADINCSINDQIQPDPALGILDPVHSGFVYTSPQTVPLENPLRFRCEVDDVPGVFAAMEIEIVAPVPPPGSAHIAASHGGTIESVQGDVILSIPAGALTTDTFITVQQLDPDVLAIQTDDANNHAAIRLEPTGIQFIQPVTVTFPLRNWIEPGSQIPLYLFDEGTGDLSDTGNKAIADESGLKATASIDHFSTHVARVPLTTEQILAKQAVKDLVITNPFLLSEFAITLSPDMPLMEGLSVPVLVNRREGALPGLGPFTEASSLSVSVTIEGYPGADTPASVGPIIQPTPDGWELGTIINLGTLPDCGAGNTTRGELTISYEKIDIEDRVSIPFTIQCLDELIFSRTEPPDFVPPDIIPSLREGKTYEHNGLLVSYHQDGTYIVEMMYPGQTYRFSTVDIGDDGILTYTPRQPPGSAVYAPFMLEVTGDVRVAGTISLAGQHGIKGEDGGTACDDCGGEGAIGTSLNSGAGGYGGDYIGPCDAVCCVIFQSLGRSCPKNATFHSGQNGQSSIDWPYGGGQGGIAWEKVKWQNFLTSIPSFVLNAGACVGGAPGACFSAAIAIGDIYGAADGMANNDLNYIRSAGEGGGNNGANAPLDIAYFNPPIAGGGGGGAGRAEISLEDDEAGGGGGGGGGAAANLKLVVGGRVTIEPGGFIYGQGGWGGYGGNGEDGEAAPGGGGGGGSGSAVHIIALKGVTNNDLITAPGGIGGRSGGISKDIGVEYRLALVDSAFGRNGYNGRLRVDGPFNGSDPIAMPFYRGPRLTNRVGVSMNRFSSAALGFFFPAIFSHHTDLFLRLLKQVGSIRSRLWLETYTPLMDASMIIRSPFIPGKRVLSSTSLG